MSDFADLLGDLKVQVAVGLGAVVLTARTFPSIPDLAECLCVCVFMWWYLQVGRQLC